MLLLRLLFLDLFFDFDFNLQIFSFLLLITLIFFEIRFSLIFFHSISEIETICLSFTINSSFSSKSPEFSSTLIVLYYKVTLYHHKFYIFGCLNDNEK